MKQKLFVVFTLCALMFIIVSWACIINKEVNKKIEVPIPQKVSISLPQSPTPILKSDPTNVLYVKDSLKIFDKKAARYSDVNLAIATLKCYLDASVYMSVSSDDNLLLTSQLKKIKIDGEYIPLSNMSPSISKSLECLDLGTKTEEDYEDNKDALKSIFEIFLRSIKWSSQSCWIFKI